MFKTMTLKKQLLSAFAIVIAVFTGLTLYQTMTAAGMDADTNELFDANFVPAVLAGEIRSDVLMSNIWMRRYLGADETRRAEVRQALDDPYGDIAENYPLIRDLATDAELVHLDAFDQGWQELTSVWEQVMSLEDEGDSAAAEALLSSDEHAVLLDQVNEAVGSELDVLSEQAGTLSDEASASYDQSRTLALIVTLIAVFGGAALAWSVARTVTRKVQGSATGVSTNVDSLAAVSAQLSSSAEETSAQANVAAAAAEQVSASVQTVSAAVEERGASVREIAQNTTTASTVASRAVDVADQTSATVAKLSASSVEI
uniref:MCP four helix bundle domain-containing protein n=1 Tax=Euzebya sp. TaxID=1971409 RepID=UPI0035164FEC